ncbi:hypothetical protein GCM10009839_64200 [Catenulispora yoronensis]|uniref:Uncharacterized protein n=1 Tax=Catenulispora yoronensis TaxID=450799 RepID=A0ABP5GKP2_9ACTN
MAVGTTGAGVGAAEAVPAASPLPATAANDVTASAESLILFRAMMIPPCM